MIASETSLKQQLEFVQDLEFDLGTVQLGGWRDLDLVIGPEVAEGPVEFASSCTCVRILRAPAKINAGGGNHLHLRFVAAGAGAQSADIILLDHTGKPLTARIRATVESNAENTSEKLKQIIELQSSRILGLDPDLQWIDASTAILQTTQHGASLVDLRALGETSNASLPGALRLRPWEVKARLRAMSATGQKPVLVGDATWFEANSDPFLSDLGSDVFVVRGGVGAWSRAGGPSPEGQEALAEVSAAAALRLLRSGAPYRYVAVHGGLPPTAADVAAGVLFDEILVRESFERAEQDPGTIYFFFDETAMATASRSTHALYVFGGWEAWITAIDSAIAAESAVVQQPPDSLVQSTSTRRIRTGTPGITSGCGSCP